MRTARLSAAAVFGAITAVLVIYGGWLLIESTHPHYETPGFLFAIFGVGALILAAVFAAPTVVLLRAPRSVVWWTVAALCTSTGALLLSLLLFGSVTDHNLILAAIATTGLAGVVLSLAACVSAVRQLGGGRHLA